MRANGEHYQVQKGKRTNPVEIVDKPVVIPGEAWLDIRMIRKVIIEGEGLTVKVFELRIKETAVFDERKIMERFFILPEISNNPVGITLTDLTLKKERSSRLFVVESKANRSSEQKLEIY